MIINVLEFFVGIGYHQVRKARILVVPHVLRLRGCLKPNFTTTPFTTCNSKLHFSTLFSLITNNHNKTANFENFIELIIKPSRFFVINLCCWSHIPGISSKKTPKKHVWVLSNFQFSKFLHFANKNFDQKVKCVRKSTEPRKNEWRRKIFLNMFSQCLIWEKSSFCHIGSCLCCTPKTCIRKIIWWIRIWFNANKQQIIQFMPLLLSFCNVYFTYLQNGNSFVTNFIQIWLRCNCISTVKTQKTQRLKVSISD